MADDKDGAQDKSKLTDQDIGKTEDDDNKGDIDPTIKSLQDDPDGIKKLLDTKRAANAEAAKYRKKLEQIQSAQDAADKKALEEQGKFKELADKAESEKTAVVEKFTRRSKFIGLKIEAIKQGIIDPDVIEIIPLSDVEIDDDFNVINAAEIITDFKSKKPHFFKADEGGGDEGDPQKTTADSRKADFRKKSNLNMKDMNRHSRIASGLKIK